MDSDVEHERLAHTRLALLSALIDGDRATSERLIRSAIDRGVALATVLEHLVGPVQAQLGESWRVGNLSVTDEHLSTATLASLVSALAAEGEPTHGRPTVVVACAEGDPHALPGLFIHAVLAAEGFPSRHLGGQIPPADLAEWLEATEVDAVLLSCTVVSCLPGARRCIEAIHSVGRPVLAGGRAFGKAPARARRLGADAWSSTAREAIDALETWVPDVAAAEARARSDTDLSTADEILDRRHQIAALAVADLEPHRSGARRSTSYMVEELIAVAAATAMLSDPTCWTEHLGWWRDPSGAQGVGVSPQRVGRAVIGALFEVGITQVADLVKGAMERPVLGDLPSLRQL